MSEVKEAPPTTPITKQPVPQSQPVDSPAYKQITAVTGTEKWTNGLFDCFTGDDNLCLKGFCCPCFVFGKTQARIRDPSLASYERVNNDCLLWCGANCCQASWITTADWHRLRVHSLTFLKRSEIRSAYNIQGDHMIDCLSSAFCHCCALIQQEKEVIRKNALRASDQDKGYQAPVGMSMNVGAEPGPGPGPGQ
ncbi:Protein plant cadmium resistance 7-like [Lachnellula hyalina]|uniref:Protein plant cadmium resistance 7-like n=1 Tax=Lachnellula hyalina TaxID=1316788 RepID=A0A8H8R3X4_9HELO|nr:Protein plant cadmium resistance 7-like [Lachnellula hyalina]TVY27993.1 Protein plant cadmium resistance 7-like [Lachnellula hyalina]